MVYCKKIKRVSVNVDAVLADAVINKKRFIFTMMVGVLYWALMGSVYGWNLCMVVWSIKFTMAITDMTSYGVEAANL